MNWRPEGWKNPHHAEGDFGEGLVQWNDYPEFSIFEAGADAYAEALKKEGCMMSPEQMKLIAPGRQHPYGWLVFIPDEGQLDSH